MKGNCEYQEDWQASCTDKHKFVVGCVCDGMHEENVAGKLAAVYVAEKLTQKKYLELTISEWFNLIVNTNGELYASNLMGKCTLALAQVELQEENNKAIVRIFNCGDTRIYYVSRTHKAVELLSVDDRLELCSSELLQCMGLEQNQFDLHYKEFQIPYSNNTEFAILLLTDGAWELLLRDEAESELRERGRQLKNGHMFEYLKGQLVLANKAGKILDNATLMAILVE